MQWRKFFRAAAIIIIARLSAPTSVRSGGARFKQEGRSNAAGRPQSAAGTQGTGAAHASQT